VRYKVVVTKVDVAERWVRATDEEHAAAKVKEELATPWAYAGKWETKATEVAVVDAEPEATNLAQGSASETGTLLLNLKDAASELGISYGTLHALMNRGDIEFTQVGSRKRISRESLAQFVRANTHPRSAGT
jgi:excisionase family DNA binding protein